jgi:TonB-dependent receptor
VSDLQKRNALAQLIKSCLKPASFARGGMSAIALGAIAISSPAAFGQNADAGAPKEEAENLTEVVVTGIRSSLESSQELKKSAEVFVDSVTAEDIGALPDRSVTEVLQRIPGVAINRFAGANDPDHFSIEGSGVVVRGLNQVRSELNGRDTFSANNGRYLSFADVPPELMIGVDVYKNQSADLIEGGLAGTVNLRTRTPFDAQGRVIGASLEANYGDFAEEWTPTGSLLYSDRWETGAGNFGILLNGVYSQLKSRSDGAQASSFQQRPNRVPGNPAADDLWFPSGAAFRTQDYDRERIGGALAAQWSSTDDTMIATLQFLRSDATTTWTEHAVEIATDVVEQQSQASYPQNGTTFDFNDEGVFTNGLITANTGWRADQQTAGNQRTPVYGLQSNNIARGQNDHYITSDYALNFKWRPNDDWALTFDAQHVKSTTEVLSMTMWGATFENAAIDLTHGIPRVQFFGPSNDGSVDNCTPSTAACPSYFNGAHNSFSDPYNSFWRAAMDHIEESEGEEDAFKIDVERSFQDLGALRGVKFGARMAEREQTTRYTTYNWAALSEIWGNGGPVWFTDPADGTPGGTTGTPAGERTELFAFDNFMRGSVPVPAVLPFYSGNLTTRRGYDEMSAYALNVGGEWVANNGGSNSWEPLADPRRGALVPGTPFLPSEINITDEKTDSLYAMLKFGSPDGTEGFRVSGNVGVRFVRTDFTADGSIAYPNPSSLTSEADCLNPPPSQTTPTAFCALPADQRAAARAFATGTSAPVKANHKYENWLPSFNIKFNFTDEVLMRMGFSKAMARPDLGLTRSVFNMAPRTVNGVWSGWQVGETGGGTGNPYLKPTTSTQYDMSVEWYFAKVGSVTASLFYKELEDVLTNGFGLVPVTNGGQTYDVYTVQPVNSDQKGKVKGYELGYQQFYDMLPSFWSGFGINANYTFIDSSGVAQSSLNATTANPASSVSTVDTSLLPLAGLSRDNINFTLMYEKGPVSARVGYSWRSRFLLTVRDVITPFAPIFNEDTGQLDASFMYSINDHIKVGFQGVNLSNEITKTTQVLDDSLLTAGRSWFMNDRRYSLIARMTF